MPRMTKASPSKRERALTELWTTNVGDFPTAIALSPRGELAFIGTAGGELVAIDVASGTRRWAVAANAGGVLSVSSGEDRVVAGGQDGQALLFDHTSGVRCGALPGRAGWVEHVAWSIERRAIAITSGKYVRVWNEDGTPLLESEAHPSTVMGVQWSRDGAALASIAYGGAYVWLLARGATAKHYPFHGSLIALAWSPDAKVLACATQDRCVHFWRLPSGRDAEMSGYPFKPKPLAWDARSSMLATGGGATICVWDFGGRGPEGTAPLELAVHRAQVSALAWSPRKALVASGAHDTGVAVWAPRSSKEPIAYAFLDDTVERLVWSITGERLLALDASGTFRAFDVAALS